MTPDTTTLRRPRRGWLALLLGLLWFGLGHLYAGTPRRAIAAWVVTLFVVAPLAFHLRVFLDWSPASVIVGLAISVGLFLLVPLDAALTARRRRALPPTRWNRIWVYIAYAVLSSLLAGPIGDWQRDRFLFRSSRIPSSAMTDTLLPGDHIYTDTRRSNLFPIRRGDIVVFYIPTDPEVLFVKRVIGLPGETVELRDGFLYVDGVLPGDNYISPWTTTTLPDP